ncbi:hypothetical protein ABBQ38_010273 [Trebouxia sp. C0009 RCD-2024]
MPGSARRPSSIGLHLSSWICLLCLVLQVPQSAKTETPLAHPNHQSCHTASPGVGCPCTAEQASTTGACSAGFICRKLWFASQNHSHPSDNDTARCWPCSFGQYCPSGSYLPDDPYSLPQAVEQHTCRTGNYCPTPDVMLPCPPGTFCSQGSVDHTTCEYQRLMDQAPGTIIPARPFTVHDRVYDAGDPLGGNFCPYNSSTPLQPCKKGFYCPDASTILPCPEGKFCKWWSRRPKSCPWLATCRHGSTSADLSLAGFFFMLLILLMLWLAYVACEAYIRLHQGVVIQRQQAKEKLHKLVAPLLALHNADQLSLQALGAIHPRLSLSFSEVGATLKDGTIILQGVTGHFNNAKVAAVMGPSGAGKTTFLNALMGTVKYGTISGQVWVNGRAMKMSRLRRIMGFVPQDDIVHEDLTVRENLEYSAWLRNPKYMRTRAKGDLVDDVIDVLNLRSVQHSVVGTAEKRGISGGQRKRVNIGLELVSKPSLLFMDEPTSGLDATAATDILTALKRHDPLLALLLQQ